MSVSNEKLLNHALLCYWAGYSTELAAKAANISVSTLNRALNANGPRRPKFPPKLNAKDFLETTSLQKPQPRKPDNPEQNNRKPRICIFCKAPYQPDHNIKRETKTCSFTCGQFLRFFRKKHGEDAVPTRQDAQEAFYRRLYTTGKPVPAHLKQPLVFAEPYAPQKNEPAPDAQQEHQEKQPVPDTVAQTAPEPASKRPTKIPPMIPMKRLETTTTEQELAFINAVKELRETGYSWAKVMENIEDVNVFTSTYKALPEWFIKACRKNNIDPSPYLTGSGVNAGGRDIKCPAYYAKFSDKAREIIDEAKTRGIDITVHPDDDRKLSLTAEGDGLNINRDFIDDCIIPFKAAVLKVLKDGYAPMDIPEPPTDTEPKEPQPASPVTEPKPKSIWGRLVGT